MNESNVPLPMVFETIVRTPLVLLRKNHPSTVKVLSCSAALSGALKYAVVPLSEKAWLTLPVVKVAPPVAVALFGPTASTPFPSARYHATMPLGSVVHDVGVTVVVLLP